MPSASRNDNRVVASGLVLLLLVLWLGFLVHRSPDFAGSAWGGVLAVAGASLMLVPLAYSLVKRIAPLRKVVTARLPLGRFLQLHIYAGLIGTLLVILHTGHKFDSVLGIVLTAMTLLVTLSGFVGRYLLGFISEDVRDRRNRLEALRNEYQRVAGNLGAGSSNSGAAEAAGSSTSGLFPVMSAIADLEYGLAAEDRLRRFFSVWLRFHLVISAVLYLLLGLHVWAALEFGLRWFQ